MVRFLAPRPARHHSEDQWAVVVFRPIDNGRAAKSVHWFANRFTAWTWIERSCDHIRTSKADGEAEIVT